MAFIIKTFSHLNVNTLKHFIIFAYCCTFSDLLGVQYMPRGQGIFVWRIQMWLTTFLNSFFLKRVVNKNIHDLSLSLTMC